MERNRVAYPPLEARLRGACVSARTLCDDLAQQLAEAHVARLDAEKRVIELEERCMWAEGALAGLRAELKGLLQRVSVGAYTPGTETAE